jgi:hypothetical protein
MLDSVVAHASAEYEVVLYVDDDDASMADFHADAKIVRGPQRTLSDCWNACWWEASGDIFGMMGDDVVIESTDWDGMVRRAFEAVPDRIAFVYGTDGFRNEEHGSHGFVHRNWTDVVAGSFLRSSRRTCAIPGSTTWPRLLTGECTYRNS